MEDREYEGVQIDVSEIAKAVAQALDRIPMPRAKPPTIDELSLGGVVGYFKEHHPGDPRIRAGALLRTPHPGGHLVHQIFLDADYSIAVDSQGQPYGRRMVAGCFDSLLDSKFEQGNDLVIFS